MRIVLDTNVFIAVALGGEFAEDILDAIITNPQFILVISEEIIFEIEQKLQGKFHWPEEKTSIFIDRIIETTEVVLTTEKISIITRDPKDNKILECAVAGEADLIVTSDQDLIKLKKFRKIGIIHPTTFTWTFPDYFDKNDQ